jgi:glycosyltransferase involved in cell wall biosynthesis
VDVERVSPGERLRIAVIGDFDGVHTRSWLRWFIERGHDVHAVSFYPSREPIDGVTMHALRPARRDRAHGDVAASTGRSRLPRGPLRLAHALRYRAAGLARVLRSLNADVVHGHYLVEHGFYGAIASVHPYIVTTWGSDVLVEPGRDPVSNLIARFTVRRADLITSNNAYMAERIIALGAPRSKVEVVTLGADRYFTLRHAESVNVLGRSSGTPCVLSTRAHELLYNIDEIIEAFGKVVRTRPDTRLVVAHGGSRTPELQRQAAATGGRVEFLGFLDRAAFRDALTDAEVFVSVPSSDGTSVALLQAMAAGCFPIVANLPTQRELVEDGVSGYRVPLHQPDVLAQRIGAALANPELRRSAAMRNRELVELRGLNENEMLRMEALYRRLCGVS